MQMTLIDNTLSSHISATEHKSQSPTSTKMQEVQQQKSVSETEVTLHYIT